MNIGFQQFTKRGVNQPVPGQRQLSGKRGGDYLNFKMSAAVARARMSGMPVTLIGYHQMRGLESLLQLRADAGNAVAAHGNTRLNGLTTTREYTPAARYGSASAQVCASDNESNSATISDPEKPATVAQGMQTRQVRGARRGAPGQAVWRILGKNRIQHQALPSSR